jgi:hypothetical protein
MNTHNVPRKRTVSETKGNRGVEVKFPSFLISAQDGGEQSVSESCRHLYPLNMSG